RLEEEAAQKEEEEGQQAVGVVAAGAVMVAAAPAAVGGAQAASEGVAAAAVGTGAGAAGAGGSGAAEAGAIVAVPAAAAAAGGAAAAGAGGSKERKPHWTKVITLKTEDRLRLLVEHLNTHRFISRVQVRRLVMEWESAVSGKPVPNSAAGPDIKTIRRLMDRLAEAGKAKIIRVDTSGFLGDNRPVDVLLRPDLEPTPELLEEMRRQMADFERRLRSECCRRALAARRVAGQEQQQRVGD
ncbi:hypothetical protein Agub_g4812, partial [Astrephomene gubernaculifera]